MVTSDWLYPDLALVVGFAYAVKMGDVAIATPDGRALKDVTLPADDRAALTGIGVFWLNRWLGLVERALYFCALSAGGGAAIIVPAWLAIKFIGVGDLRSIATGDLPLDRARRLFQRSQILNVVSLGYAAVGWKVSTWLGQTPQHHVFGTSAQRWIETGTVAIGLPILTFWLRHQIASTTPPLSPAALGVPEVTVEVTK